MRSKLGILFGFLTLMGRPGVAQLELGDIVTAPAADVGFLFGHEVAAGDVDADGLMDLLVSVPATGLVRLYLGDPEGFADPVATLSNILPQGNPSMVPQPIALADVTCPPDGRADALVGQPQFDFANATDSGEVRVYEAMPAAPFLPASPTSILRPDKSQEDGRFGWSIAVGDFDGDGCGDVLVGEPRFNFVATGRVSVFPSPLAAGISSPGPGDTRLGAHDDDRFGFTIAAANVIGGPEDDAIIGSPAYDEVANRHGRVQVFPGSPAGLAGVASNTFLDPCPISGTPEFGRFVAAGDVDGNGFADVAAGSRFISDCQPFPGKLEDRVHVYLSDGVNLSLMPGSPAVAPDLSGNTIVFEAQMTVGDVTRDGLGDLIVGAPGAVEGGRVYVFAGSASPPGVATTASQTLASPDVAGFVSSVDTGNVLGSSDAELLAGTPLDAFSAGEVLVFTVALIFADGFESGDTGNW